ncbi:hypothetical protein FFI16_003610 [Pseudomonas sp. KBS0710]|uniref:hypothetical protein n=1 Tax=Pseudomonas sp. KBS0710 TaxID=1179667 RepID=UPI00110D3522|nr:hypothetical protein [Pseudomonas sp. KBS0710]TSD75542.1 hypothetical protein FFI16_003610 [Pseudomonas sp. KBS0710]
MVNHDCENPETAQKYIDKLKSIHQKTKELKNEIDGLQLTQFSDSIVLALPYKKESFIEFSKLVSNYQYELLGSGIICRGGISYGMHHYEDDFLFSSGLIHAYNIEKDISINPRIVISKDLVDLLYPDTKDTPQKTIIKESDGAYFINFLADRNPTECWEFINQIVPENLASSPSIRGKQIWLINYYNHSFPENIIRRVEKFT